MPRTRPSGSTASAVWPYRLRGAHQDRGRDVERARQGKRVHVQRRRRSPRPRGPGDLRVSPGRPGPRPRSPGSAASRRRRAVARAAAPRPRSPPRPRSGPARPPGRRRRGRGSPARAGGARSLPVRHRPRCRPAPGRAGAVGPPPGAARRTPRSRGPFRGRVERPAKLLVVRDLAAEPRAAAVQRPVQQHRRGALAPELAHQPPEERPWPGPHAQVGVRVLAGVGEGLVVHPHQDHVPRRLALPSELVAGASRAASAPARRWARRGTCGAGTGGEVPRHESPGSAEPGR